MVVISHGFSGGAVVLRKEDGTIVRGVFGLFVCCLLFDFNVYPV